jgi:hypothetical protein
VLRPRKAPDELVFEVGHVLNEHFGLLDLADVD